MLPSNPGRPFPPLARSLHIKPELDDVAVGHDVVLAFHADASVGAGLGEAAVFDQVVVADDLGLDETALKVGVDHSGGLRRSPALVDRPGA